MREKNDRFIVIKREFWANLVCVTTWIIKPKTVSVVELDPQALLTIGTHIVKISYIH